MKKTINKVLTIFIFGVLFLLYNANMVHASDAVIATGSGGENITWSLNDSGVLTISGKGNMKSGENVSSWADYQSQVKSVKFEGDITSISSHSFENNTNIENIVLPNTVTSIGEYSFAQCTNLKEVVFPKNIATINGNAFYQCTSLKAVDLPNGLMYIKSGAFAECTSLQDVTIRAPYCLVSDDSATISDTAKIHAYRCSYPFYYARRYGRTFVDLITNEESTETITNDSYLQALPTSNVKALGITAHHLRSFGEDGLSGYSPEFCFEKDTTNATYNKIKNVVEQTTVDCKNDTEKAKAILNWICSNVKYGGSASSARIDNVYYFFEKLQGNCEVHTLVTNYMLYLCDIPTATATSATHMWSVAYLDGQWTYIDATGNIFGGAGDKATEISFAYDGLIYVVNDPSQGGYVTGIAKSNSEIKNLSSYTIPSNPYMKGIYQTSFSDELELKAQVGTVAEKFIRENRVCCKVNGTEITGRSSHNDSIVVDENVVEETCTENGHGQKVTYCSDCGQELRRTNYTISKKHKYDPNNVVIKNRVEPTCTRNGYYNKVSYCSRCGYEDTETVILDKIEHKYETKEENGYLVTKCVQCGNVKSKTSINKDNSSSNGSTANKESTANTGSTKNKVSKVTGLKAKSQSTTSITLSWSKVSGASKYQLYKYNSSKKKWEKVTTTSKTSYTVKKLKAGTTYKFRVRAYKTISKKNYYGSYSSTLETATKTKTPKISKITSKSKKATISWKKVSGSSGYEVYMATSKKGKYSKVKSANSKTVKYTKSSLKKKKTYYFKIRTYKKVSGKKIYSSYSSVKSIKVK